MSDFFRRQAVENRKPKFYGTILLTYSGYSVALTVFFAICLLGCLAGFFFLGFSRTEELRGVVVPANGLMEMQAAVSGSVQAVSVHEGKRVQAGELLFLLRHEEFASVDKKSVGVPAGHDVNAVTEVRALTTGTAVSVSVRPGHVVSVGQALLQIAPAGAPLMVELYAPASSVGFLRAGMRVDIRYDALPHEKYGQFSGMVREVSLVPVDPSEARGWIRQQDTELRPYRVSVELLTTRSVDPGQSLPRPGMLLTASVSLEYRRLYEWVLKPKQSLALERA